MAGRKEDDEREAFARAVEGVRPLDPGKPKAARPKQKAASGRRDGQDNDAPVAFLPHEDGEQAGFRAPDVSREELRQLRRGEHPIGLVLDLHGHGAQSARRELKRALEEAEHTGTRVLRIVHGKGNHSLGPAVLRDVVLETLKGPPFAAIVAACAPAPPGAGGAGATLVLLRRKRRGGRS